MAAFVSDSSPSAYEALVDRLLASPHYGEHMAVRWLDAARYADTSGYQNDGPRSMWRWRDWVINAFNTNQRFDEFTVDQLAGDLLPDPSMDQRIATGFNRNHRGNAEGGIIPEEYQVEYVVDRVDTTATVWLGLTLGCARCHDHKYDPVSQREYYQLFAYFNNIPESGRAIKEGNSPPYIKAPLPEEIARLEELDREIDALGASRQAASNELQALQLEWEHRDSAVTFADDGGRTSWPVTDLLLHHFRFDGNATDTLHEPQAIAQQESFVFTAGPIQQAVALTDGAVIAAGDVANFGYFDKFSITAWIRTTSADGTIVSRMTPVDEGAGYAVHLRDGHLQVNLVKRWLDDAIRVESHEKIPLGQWSHLAVTYDGTRQASGIKVYLNGRLLPMDVKLDRINQNLLF